MASMKKFFLKRNKKGKLKWFVRDGGKLRRASKKEKEELQSRINSETNRFERLWGRSWIG